MTLSEREEYSPRQIENSWEEKRNYLVSQREMRVTELESESNMGYWISPF